MTIKAFKGRLEDRRFLTGVGKYVADVTLPRQAYMALVLSPYAHADIRSIETTAAAAMPGVIAVLTGADLTADGLGSVPPFFMPALWGGPNGHATLRPILISDRVRCVGERVAIVIAETAQEAGRAAEAVEIDYAPLEAVIDPEAALATGAPHIWPDCPTGNLSVVLAMGDKEKTAAAFSAAAHVVRLRLVTPRVAPTSLEPRGCIGEFDPADERYTLWTSSQDPHGFRKVIASNVLKIDENRLRVISPDVGGGFGLKSHMHPEDALVLWAARRTGRPVKWISSRSEAFLTDTQGRGQTVEAEMALAVDGRVLGLRATAWHNLGAYFWGTATPPLYFSLQLIPSVYDIPAVDLRTQAVFTNMPPMSVYRGAGRPEAIFVVERLMDAAAVKLNIDPADLRRRNLIAPQAMPYTTSTGMIYDSGRFAEMMEQTLEAADWQGFAQRLAASKTRGLLRGRSITPYIEIAGVMNERMELRFDPDGSLSIVAGTHSHGQGHATVFSQMIADWLSFPIERIRYIQGDTDQVLIGRGTFAARSSMLGGTALLQAKDKLLARAAKMAAILLQAPEDQIAFADGLFRAVQSNQTIPLTEVAKMFYLPAGPANVLGIGLSGEGTAAGKPGGAPNYPNGCLVCEVEVNPDTGAVHIDTMTVFDDVGRILNDVLCEGQIHGGIAQGMGQALFEEMVYDQQGQLLSGSLMDYALPRADHMPDIISRLLEVPCTTNALGVKGIGESGAIGTPVAIVNAVLDAVRSEGIDTIDMPVTQPKLWMALQAAREARP